MKGYKYTKAMTFKKYHFKVSDVHEIYVEERGNPNGVPVICFHGGPGGGINDQFSTFFDPKYYHVILFDQRGCGKSLPYLETKDNNIFFSIEDAEKLRESLGIDKWFVFGGSYGSTLSLAYGVNHPNRCLGLIIRGVFLGTNEEVDWLYKYGAGCVFPEMFDYLKSYAPLEKQDDLLEFYYQEIQSGDKTRQLEAATRWENYEHAVSYLEPVTEFPELLGEKEIAMAVMETHYFHEHIFPDEMYLLKNISKLKDIPVHVVHGRYDMCCHVKAAYELKKALPSCILYITMAGHSQFDPNNLIKLTEIMDSLKTKK